MNRSIYLGLVLLFSVLLSCGSSMQIQEPAPPITGELTDGSTLQWESLRGEWLLVEFWGSWCGPCLREMPEIVRVEKEYGPRGLQVLSIGLEKRKGNWIKVVEQFDMDWPLQMVRDIDYVRFDDIASAYGVTDIPAKFLIDENGVVILENPNIVQLEEALKTRYKN